MRDVAGGQVSVNGRTVYVEKSGQGQDWVVFEAGGGCGRTCWDPVLPLLSDKARLVAYDRSGRARTGGMGHQLSVDDMAADLVAMTEAVVPGKFVLVAHSMGGLVARRAAERLGSRLRGLLLVDALPETAPVYDTWDQTTKKIDRMLAVTQALSRFRPLAGLFSGNVRRLFSADTYQTMLGEDFTPAGISQTREEMQAVAAAIPQFRAHPPQPPTCPTIVLSAARAAKGRERQHAAIREHQRRYAGSLPDGRCESVDSAHFIQAEQPQVVVARILQLLQATTDRDPKDPGSHAPLDGTTGDIAVCQDTSMPPESSMTYRKVGRILHEIGMISEETMQAVVAGLGDPADNEVNHYAAAGALESFGVAVSIHGDDIDSIYEDYAELIATAAEVAGGRVTLTNVRLVPEPGGFERGRTDRLEFERDGVPVAIDAVHYADDYFDSIAASTAISCTAADDDPRSWHHVDFTRDPHRTYDEILVLATPDQVVAMQERFGFQLFPG